MTPVVERFRAAVACLLLTAAVFVQRPGLLVPDTKLDLAVDPLDWLSRGLSLWDPEGGAGQLQNQAYGYLFPMGPFFALLQGAGLPAWSVQRLWQAMVLCVAFLGVRALAARLGMGTPGTRLLAGLVYALASRPLSQLGAISVEVWPYALAPWVLLPLVTGAERGSPRRAAALSGVAVLCVGGVNAAATLAVVPLGVLWLATRAPGPRRRALSAWWALSVVLACAWWAGPLVLLGRYSPPFLDVIESAATTTGTTGLWSVLTGNDLWQQYLATGAGPARAAGFLLVTEPALVLCTTALAALGLAALLRPATPHRGFLNGGVLLGVCVVGAGHVGDLRLQAGIERDLLDAALAPFRNVHKYDLLLRLPLALGLAALAAEVRRPHVKAEALRRPVAVLAALALVGAASPLAQVQQPGAFGALPDYWTEAADWLADRHRDGAGRALLVPAASSGTYAWGRPGDEPLQPLADSPWLVRDAVPLGGPGITRVLDRVEEVLQSGRGSAELPSWLGRSGVRYVVVRNDLDARVTGYRPLTVHASLRASGFVRVAAFGPQVGLPTTPGGGVVDAGLQEAAPAVEVFAVGRPSGLVSALPRAGTQRVSGGPESLLPLLEADVVGPRTPVRLSGEPPLPGEEAELRTVTDGYRDREANVGRAADPYSATLGAGVEVVADRPVHDYLPVPEEGTRTTAEVRGLAEVTASSSAAEADAVLGRGRDRHPVAAFDGSPTTTWVTGGFRPLGQWVQARTEEPVRLLAVRLSSPLGNGVDLQASRVRITTDAGSRTAVLAAGALGVGALGAEVVLPAGPTSRVRLTVEEALGPFGPADGGVVALEAQLVQAGAVPRVLTPQRVLRTSADSADATGGRPAQAPVALALEAGTRDRPGCLRVLLRPLCSPDLPLGDEDVDGVDRVVVLDRPTTAMVGIRARVRPGEALDALLQADQEVKVTGLAQVADPADRAAAVLDGDLSTAWVSSPRDPRPGLLLTWERPRDVVALRVALDRRLAASRPAVLRINGIRDGREVAPDELLDGVNGGGRLIRPLRGVTGLVVRVHKTTVRGSLGLDGSVDALPVGISELEVRGDRRLPVRQVLDPDRPVLGTCGDGPSLTVDGRLRVRTRLQATVGDLLSDAPLNVVPCSRRVALMEGERRLRVARTAFVQATGLTLTDVARPAVAAGPARVTDVVRWGASARAVQVGAGPESWLVVRENANDGWEATLDGRRLRPARLDGWQQAFVLPAGEGGRVELRYAPDRPYRLSLVIGAVLALLLLGLALLPGRAGPPAPGSRPARRLLVVVLTGGAVLLAAGWVGALLLAALGLVHRRAPRLLAPLGVGALVVAGASVALRPWPDALLLSLPVQVLCAAALAALAVSLWPRPAADPAPTT